MLLVIISGVTHTGTHFSTSTHNTVNAMNAAGTFIRNSFNSLLYNGVFFIVLSVFRELEAELAASEIPVVEVVG